MDLEAGVRSDHPLRPIREIANTALADLTQAFDALCPPWLGRPSIPPQRLLRAMLLQASYGLRFELQLMERMEFDLLFRWFVGFERSGVGALFVHQELRPATRRRDRR